MIDVQIDLDVFNAAYVPYLDDTTRTQIFYGGSSSGKSVFLAQRDVMDVMKGGRNFLVCRQVGRTLRGSVVQEVRKVISEWGLSQLFDINKTDGTVTCRNGYQIVFAGLDDVEKLKSLTPAKGVITDVRIEEATETDRATIKQLEKRQRGGDPTIPKRMTLSFNPVLKSSWIYQDYFAPVGWADDQTEYRDGRLSIFKTWYIHNRFLTPDDVYDLEHEADEYFRNVYTFGNWGVLGDVIFTNWVTADLNDPASAYYLPPARRTNHRFGLDFGFSSDPAAAVFTHYDRSRRTIYIYDEYYERGATNDVLAADLRPLVGGYPLVCDSAEPKSIAELQQYNVEAIAAGKGRDSVLHGVQWLQQQTIVVDKSCVNMQNELQQYQWRKDKDGHSLRQPVDKNNHLIDALRYAYEQESVSVEAGAFTYA